MSDNPFESDIKVVTKLKKRSLMRFKFIWKQVPGSIKTGDVQGILFRKASHLYSTYQGIWLRESEVLWVGFAWRCFDSLTSTVGFGCVLVTDAGVMKNLQQATGYESLSEVMGIGSLKN